MSNSDNQVPEPTSYRGCGHQRPATNLKRLLAGTRAHQLAAQVSLGLHQTARCLTSHPPPTATPALDRTTSRGPRGGYLASHPLCSADQRLTFNARPHNESTSGMPTLVRPSFTVILWGCSMPLWPRILQHIQSKVDGDVSVANMQLPAEVLPFLEAVCALLPRPHTCSAHPSTPLSALTASVCDYARCRQVRQAISDKQSISHRKKNRPSPHKAMLKPRWLTLCGSVFGGFFWR